MDKTAFIKEYPLQYSLYLKEAVAFRKIIKEVNESYVIICKEELGVKVGKLQMYDFYVHCPTTSFANAYARIGMLYTERVLPIWNARFKPKTVVYKDLFGFEVIGLAEAKTDEDKVEALEKHIDLIEGLSSEVILSLEKKASQLKYPQQTKKNGKQKRVL